MPAKNKIFKSKAQQAAADLIASCAETVEFNFMETRFRMRAVFIVVIAIFTLILRFTGNSFPQAIIDADNDGGLLYMILGAIFLFFMFYGWTLFVTLFVDRLLLGRHSPDVLYIDFKGDRPIWDTGNKFAPSDSSWHCTRNPNLFRLLSGLR